MKLQNLHTHCTYCDGKNTMEEVVQTAIQKGFSSIGFSSHSYMPYRNAGLMPEDKPQYLKDIATLKEKYCGVIDIFGGLEYERYSEDDMQGYDYIIGSCHYFERDGIMHNFDCTADNLLVLVKEQFGGDAMAMVKEYYKTFATLPEVYDFDIAGHCDIITKNNQKLGIFDETSKEYLDVALESILAVAEKIKIFEMNTGPIARGYRSTMYPAKTILKELKAHGALITVSSDCHKMEFLDTGFRDAFELAKECGYKEIMIFDGKEFVPEKID